MGDVIELYPTKYIAKVFGGDGHAMVCLTNEEAEEVLGDNAVSDGDGGRIYPINHHHPWYNGIC